MAVTKLSAFYFTGIEWKKVNRWELYKMADTQLRKFRYETNRKLHLSPSSESPNLYYNRGHNTFSYWPNQAPKSTPSDAGMTISHLLAQEVISEIRVLNLELTDKRTTPYKKVNYKVEVDRIIQEQKITVGENFYMADLLVRFSKPCELSFMWDGTFVLEVFMTSDTKGQQIIDFERRGIPLLELNIWSKLKNRKKISNVSQEEEDHLRGKMHAVFRKKILADIHVSTLSNKYKEHKIIQQKNESITSLNLEVSELRRANTSAIDSYSILVTKYNQAITSLKDKKEQLNSMKNSLEQKENEFELLKSRPLVQKIADIFNSNKQ